MKAAVYDHTGGPEVLRYAEVPDPECFPGAVVIEVAAISIEGGDTLNRAGGDMPAVPHIVGYQCAGTIIEVGEGVTDRHVGQQVVTTMMWGSHAEKVVTFAGTTWPLPEGSDLVAMACVPIAFGTARRLPVRVRPPAGRRDRADPGGSRRRRASPRSSSPSAPARRCSPRRPATSGSTA